LNLRKKKEKTYFFRLAALRFAFFFLAFFLAFFFTAFFFFFTAFFLVRFLAAFFFAAFFRFLATVKPPYRANMVTALPLAPGSGIRRDDSHKTWFLTCLSTVTSTT